MDERGNNEESLSYHIEQLERERDELRKDIEQLCIQQAGPSYLPVATRMHFQSPIRIAGLEQEIESLKKKLAGCIREKQNLQEELSEAYRIKSQLADLHGEEVSKNKEAEKQVKFFQSCVAAAFAERDQALMEFEKAKEQEEAVSQKLIDFQKRVEELELAYLDEKKLSASLELELSELQKKNESFEKVINKFYEVRERDTGSSTDGTLQDRCLCLLNDPSDNWIFSSDSKTSTSKYIASLEEEKEILRNSIDKLQNNLRMGLDIERHLKKNVQSLEKKHIILDDFIRNGLSVLRNFLVQQRSEVMKLLEEEALKMNTMLVEVQKMTNQIHMNHQSNSAVSQRGQQCDDSECRNVHITSDVDPIIELESGHPTTSSVKNRMKDTSDVLAQALQEKIAALLLLSQQEERHLLERDVNKALQKKLEELQINLSQVTNEKVKALMELALVKREYQLLQENCSHSLKHDNYLADDSDKNIALHEREGRLKNILKKTYLKRWMGNDHSQHDTDIYGSSGKSNSTNKKDFKCMDFARLKIENAALQESMANMERVTFSVRRLHVLLLRAQDDAASAGPTESIIQALSNIISEANHMKTALGSSLPISWSGSEEDAITYENLYEPTNPSEVPKIEKVDPVSTAGLEMVDLLILAVELQKENLIGKCGGSQI
ncbi:myosin-10-like isoform X1 [Phoenix dactylifera]|uniref:Myosin-10-like isoform X1 n=2 Tax=Phoenix dactylifera TaxID=42345 RepID=A0A8B8ZIB6_PHODC|nr:myosin-10-like isoform X1 [Phoenix dactylifera]